MDVQNEKVLIVYYSRGGSVEKVARELQKHLSCRADNVVYANGKQPSFLRACFEAVFKRTCAIKGDSSDAGKYERVIALTPVWASGLSTPIRSYLKKYRESIKSYSLVSVMSATGDPENDATAAAGKKPEKAAVFLSKQVSDGEIDYASLATLAE